MNAQAAEALYEAERKGVRQIRGSYDANGGMCAMGVIKAAGACASYFVRTLPQRGCPLCGAAALGNGHEILNEGSLVVHLNDDHGLTFGEIARKLGPDSA